MKLSPLAAVLLASVNAAAATPAGQKLALDLGKVVQDSASLPNPSADYKAKFDSQFQTALKDSKCQLQGGRVNCNAADADSVDAGNNDLQNLQTFVADEKTREADRKPLVGHDARDAELAAAAVLHQKIADQGAKVNAAISAVKDPLAQLDYHQRLNRELSKDGCSPSGAGWNCIGSPLNPEQVDVEIDNLKSLLVEVNGDNAANTRMPRLAALAQAANQQLAAISKLASTQDQRDYRQQLDQRVGALTGADGCKLNSGAYDCSTSNLSGDRADKETAWVQTQTAAINAVAANPRPDLLKQFTQAANRVPAAIATVRNPDDRTKISQKFAALMTNDACKQTNGVYDCSATTVKTEKLESEIDAVNGLLSAVTASIQAMPNAKNLGLLGATANYVVQALPNVQDPALRGAIARDLTATMKAQGCAPTNQYWDCSMAAGNDNLSSDLASVQQTLVRVNKPDINVAGSQAALDLSNALSGIAPTIAQIANKDDAAALTAKLNAVVAESGCAPKGAGYDCSKSTFNQVKQALPDAVALNTAAQRTAGNDGNAAARATQVAAAADLLKLGQKLTPQSARDAFAATLTGILKKANCDPSTAPVDCSKATMAQLSQLTKDLSDLQSKTQSQIAGAESRAADASANAQDLSKAASILDATDSSIDSAAIADSEKKKLYAVVSILRDKIENQAPAGQAAPQGPSAAQQVTNVTGGIPIVDVAGDAAALVAGLVDPQKTSGKFGATATSQAQQLQAAVKQRIADDLAHPAKP